MSHFVGTGAESFARARDIESLAGTQLRDITNSIGLDDLIDGDAVSEADPVQVFARLDVMDDSGAARRTTTATRQAD